MANYVTLPIGISRTYNAPFFDDQVFSSLEAAQAYCSDVRSYVGQIISVIENGVASAYVIESLTGEYNEVAELNTKVGVLKPIGTDAITSYTQLTDKPAIDGNELTATSTAAGLGLATTGNVATAKQEAIDAAASAVDTKLNGYYTKSATDEAISTAVEALGNIFVVKGKLNSKAELDNVVEPKAGDVYLIPSTDAEGQVEEYVYTEDGTWERLGITVETDLNGYATEQYVTNAVDGLRQEVAGAGYLTEVPMASETTLGGIKIGTGLQISEDGTVTVNGGSAASVEWAGVLNQPKINNNALSSGNNTNDDLGITSKLIHLDPTATESLQVNLGSGGTVGGYKTGDTISLTDTTILDVLRKLLVKQVPPTYTRPTLKVTGSAAREVGTEEAMTITPTYTKADGGDVTSYVIKKGTEVIETLDTVQAAAVDVHYTDAAQTYSCVVNYAEGAVKNDNLGQPYSEGHILAGATAENTNTKVTFTGRRSWFYKSTAAIETAPSTSAGVRGLMTTPDPQASSPKGTEKSFTCNEGDKQFIFACPASWGNCTLIYDNGSLPAPLTWISTTTVSVSGATDGEDMMDYTVYAYNTLSGLSAGNWKVKFN